DAALRRLHALRPAPPAKTVSPPLSKPSQAREPQKIAALKVDVTSLAYSRDGKRLAVSTADGTVVLLDPVAGQEVRRWKADPQAVFTVAVATDGQTLATAGRDQTIHLWNAATGEQLHVLPGHAGDVNAVAISPDGKLL